MVHITSHPNNDWYEELCALAAIGELSSTEFGELQQHLAECGSCRELYADFCRISSDDIGLVAAQERTEEREDAHGVLDEQELLSRLLERARRERGIRQNPAASAPVAQAQPARRTFRANWAWLEHAVRRPALSYSALALLFAAVASLGAYRLRDAQISPTVAQLHSQLNSWKSKAEATEERQKSASQMLQHSEAGRLALQKSLADARSKYAGLQAQQESLQKELSAGNARLDQLSQGLQATRTDKEQKEKLVADLRTRLDAASQRTAEQEWIVADLGRRLKQAEQAANAPAAPPVEDAEAKNLFGARDLHIVDVYDVDAAGKTRRTYGRVYYVEKKFLVFYAFDLQDKRRNRTAASFQAWGYRQANVGKPEDLGLFNVDDASLNRWVLKVNNPRVLEHIDAVFVTLEPPGGSPAPRGRKLLYANLAGPPNHP